MKKIDDARAGFEVRIAKITGAIAGLDVCITKDNRNRWTDFHIAEALGGQIRLVSKLGLNGRTKGGDRVFWPSKPYTRNGSVVPYYTKDVVSRTKAMAKLRAAIDIALHGEP